MVPGRATSDSIALMYAGSRPVPFGPRRLSWLICSRIVFAPYSVAIAAIFPQVKHGELGPVRDLQARP